MSRILIVDDEAPIREVLSASLRDEGHVVITAGDGASGLRAIEEHQPEIVFQDIWMPGSLDGIEVMKLARERFPLVDFIMISGHGTIETAVKATKLGAWDFIEKPLSMDRISIAISNIIQMQQERNEKQMLLTRLRSSVAILGESELIVQLKRQLTEVAYSKEPILLEGEMGSGKYLAVQNIHYLSDRAAKPLLVIKAKTLVPDLVDTEFFGFEKGAFSGAHRSTKGKFELAEGGTLYIDEVGALNEVAQKKLLKFMQEGKFKRVGSSETLVSNIRIVAASTMDLDKEVGEGRFDEGLFRRLSLSKVRLPSLKERPNDLEILWLHFSEQVAREIGVDTKKMSEQAMVALKRYDWPGNIREFRNFVERLYLLTPGEFIDVHDLRLADFSIGGAGSDGLSSFREARARFEKEYLLKKLAENDGNISRTAESIGLERSYLHRKIKNYGIEVSKDEV